MRIFGYFLFSVLVAIFLFFAMALWVSMESPEPVQAAPVADGIVKMCTKIATTGPIDYYYCEPEIGQPFYTNSVGFMVLEE